MEIKKTTFYGIIIGIIVVVAVIVLASGGKSTGGVVSGDIQHIVIGMENWAYSPQVIKVKAGVPVSISLDDSVGGCFRDLVIPKAGITKYLRTSEDTIVFTPEKGSYTFACSMYMGQGRIIAE